MSSAIELTGLTKRYGKARGVEDITLEVPSGSVLGFLGPNGAGKTTTISMMLNFTSPTKGNIRIFDKDSQKQGLEIRQNIGYLAGDMALDKGLTGKQQLEYLGNLRGSYDKAYVQDLAQRLDCRLDRKIKSLSRGNRQKVGLIAALMHKPDLLILDEPTNGLDPLVQAEFNRIILEHKAAGKTAFISSHVLSEVQEICDRVAIIREGQLVMQGTMADISKSGGYSVRLVVPSKPITYVTGLSGAEHAKASGKTLEFTYNGDINVLLQHLAKKPVKDITIQRTTLEDTFMKYYEGDNA